MVIQVKRKKKEETYLNIQKISKENWLWLSRNNITWFDRIFSVSCIYALSIFLASLESYRWLKSHIKRWINLQNPFPMMAWISLVLKNNLGLIHYTNKKCQPFVLAVFVSWLDLLPPNGYATIQLLVVSVHFLLSVWKC